MSVNVLKGLFLMVGSAGTKASSQSTQKAYRGLSSGWSIWSSSKRHSLEIVPKQLDRLKFLPDNKFEDVFVAFIPGDNYTNIVNASKSLLELNYNPIPHIPARTINNEDELDNFLKNLHSIGVKEVLVIGGSPKKQEGPFSKSMDLFKTGLFGKYKFKINIAGHPEGNPDDLDSDINLLEKSKWLYENKFIFSIVTQWTLDIDKTNVITMTEASYGLSKFYEHCVKKAKHEDGDTMAPLPTDSELDEIEIDEQFDEYEPISKTIH